MTLIAPTQPAASATFDAANSQAGHTCLGPARDTRDGFEDEDLRILHCTSNTTCNCPCPFSPLVLVSASVVTCRLGCVRADRVAPLPLIARDTRVHGSDWVGPGRVGGEQGADGGWRMAGGDSVLQASTCAFPAQGRREHVGSQYRVEVVELVAHCQVTTLAAWRSVTV